MRMTIEQRFWRKVDRTSDCWLWRGATRTNNGGQKYGHFDRYSAHRFVHELCIGKIPKGFVVMHLCDNTICVNPKHLRAGTQKENIKDSVKKGRRALPPATKLTLEMVGEIRRKRINSSMDKELTRIYGISLSHLRNIVAGRCWNKEGAF